MRIFGLKEVSEVGCVAAIVILLVVNFVIGGFTTRYVLEYWGTFVRQTRVEVPLFPCMLAGLFLGEVTIPAAIGTFIISAFLDNPAY
ncbi:MAG: hypothetical protein WBH42_00025 [Bacillota bacterium]